MAQIQAEPPPPTDPVEQELSHYFALLGTRLWDGRQRHNFTTYAIGLMSELERKSLEPIACSFTQDPTEAERLHYRLQNLLADAPWPDEELRQLAADYAIAAMTRRAPILVWCGDDAGERAAGAGSAVCLPLRTYGSQRTPPANDCG